MERFLKIFGLRKEAILLDSRLYIIKSMLAIGTGFIFGRMFDVTRLDMISVLLGVMYNLEATNTSTVKSGMNQLLASFLGAVTTGTLVYFFGVNVFTVMLGMGLTLFMALKIDYRSVHPVAIFTSIYMTQYIQMDALGNPSIFLTIRLRILALSLGVLIAIIFNYAFSFFYYKKISQKRLTYLKLKVEEALTLTYTYLISDKDPGSVPYDDLFSMVFSDIEIIRMNIGILKKESFVPFRNLEKENMEFAEENVRSLKTITHMAYDTCYTKEQFNLIFNESEILPLLKFMDDFNNLDFLEQRKSLKLLKSDYHEEFKIEELGKQRINNNLGYMIKEFEKIIKNHL